MPAQKITPFLWFDDNAEEAVKFYTSLFRNSKVTGVTRYGEASAEAAGRPKGTVMTVAFQLAGQDFTAINGGPEFKFTPAISFFVGCESPEEVDELWQKLSEGGMTLMELGKYDFAEKYGWLQDKYGISWQLMLGSRAQKITPFLMFVGEQCGKAEQAMKDYTSIFPNSQIKSISRYGKGGPDAEGTVNHAEFSLDGQDFMALESALEHQFTFTEATSFVVNCETRKEVDHYWEKLTTGGEEIQCGWLKDKYSVSWQVVPTALTEMLYDKDAQKSERVMKALLQMKKIDIATLRQTYRA